MTDDPQRQDQLQLQYQKQRQQQQREQQTTYRAPARGLPEKQQQAKHNPISEAAQFISHSCDQ